MKIKINDNVKVLSGKNRQKTGKVVQVLWRKKDNLPMVVVEGVNIVKKNIKAQRGQKGQIIELPAPIAMSKVMLIDPSSKKPTRVGYGFDGRQKKRLSKKTGEFIV